jgi:hypothetical protein
MRATPFKARSLWKVEAPGVEGPAEDGVEAAWEQELERRAGEIDSGAVKLEPWPKLRQELDGIVPGS